MFFFFLFGSTDISSLEKFFNHYQDFAYRIHVSIKGKTKKNFQGVFYWRKKACKTLCALIYDPPVHHRSVMVREGSKTYHYVMYDDPRNKTTKTNISNSPLHEFFEPVVSLKGDERFTKTLAKTAEDRYVLEIRYFTDTKRQKEHAKIYFKRKNQDWYFEKWVIVRCDGVTTIMFDGKASITEDIKNKTKINK